MHPENLLPLLRLLPLFVVMAAALGGYLWVERGRSKRDRRRGIQQTKSYWMAEFAHRARMRTKEWLSGTKTRRLTYQGPPLAPKASDLPKSKRRH